ALRKSLDSKLIRIHPNFDCEEKIILSVKDDCTGRVIGASRFGTLHYNNDEFVEDAIFSIEKIADLGETHILKVNSQNSLVKHFSEIPLPTTLSTTRAFHEKLASSGISSGGLHISDRIAPIDGKTFLVRIIEYKAVGIVVGPPLKRESYLFLSL